MDEKPAFGSRLPIPVQRITEADPETLILLERGFPGVQWDGDNLRAFVHSPANILLIATRNGQVAGLLRAHLLQRYDRRRSEILLHEIDVLPAHQRQGVGTALILELKAIGQKLDAPEIWVITNRSNQADMALYAKTGGNAEAHHDDNVVFFYRL